MYAVITLQQNFKLTIITAITPLTLHLEIERFTGYGRKPNIFSFFLLV